MVYVLKTVFLLSGSYFEELLILFMLSHSIHASMFDAGGVFMSCLVVGGLCVSLLDNNTATPMTDVILM